MTTTLQKWGNSQGIRIPKYLLDAVHWGENEELTVSAEGDRLILEKTSRRKTIAELFEGYDGTYSPVEIDWGEPVGGELW